MHRYQRLGFPWSASRDAYSCGQFFRTTAPACASWFHGFTCSKASLPVEFDNATLPWDDVTAHVLSRSLGLFSPLFLCSPSQAVLRLPPRNTVFFFCALPPSHCTFPFWPFPLCVSVFYEHSGKATERYLRKRGPARLRFTRTDKKRTLVEPRNLKPREKGESLACSFPPPPFKLRSHGAVWA